MLLILRLLFQVAVATPSVENEGPSGNTAIVEIQGENPETQESVADSRDKHHTILTFQSLFMKCILHSECAQTKPCGRYVHGIRKLRSEFIRCSIKPEEIESLYMSGLRNSIVKIKSFSIGPENDLHALFPSVSSVWVHPEIEKLPIERQNRLCYETSMLACRANFRHSMGRALVLYAPRLFRFREKALVYCRTIERALASIDLLKDKIKVVTEEIVNQKNATCYTQSVIHGFKEMVEKFILPPELFAVGSDKKLGAISELAIGYFRVCEMQSLAYRIGNGFFENFPQHYLPWSKELVPCTPASCENVNYFGFTRPMSPWVIDMWYGLSYGQDFYCMDVAIMKKVVKEVKKGKSKFKVKPIVGEISELAMTAKLIMKRLKSLKESGIGIVGLGHVLLEMDNQECILTEEQLDGLIEWLKIRKDAFMILKKSLAGDITILKCPDHFFKHLQMSYTALPFINGNYQIKKADPFLSSLIRCITKNPLDHNPGVKNDGKGLGSAPPGDKADTLARSKCAEFLEILEKDQAAMLDLYYTFVVHPTISKPWLKQARGDLAHGFVELARTQDGTVDFVSESSITSVRCNYTVQTKILTDPGLLDLLKDDETREDYFTPSVVQEGKGVGRSYRKFSARGILVTYNGLVASEEDVSLRISLLLSPDDSLRNVVHDIRAFPISTGNAKNKGTAKPTENGKGTGELRACSMVMGLIKSARGKPSQLYKNGSMEAEGMATHYTVHSFDGHKCVTFFRKDVNGAYSVRSHTYVIFMRKKTDKSGLKAAVAKCELEVQAGSSKW